MSHSRILIIILFNLNIFNINLQAQELYSSFDPDDILFKDQERPQVLLVGSFHFGYYGLDAHATKEEDRVNVLLPKRQKEIKELVDYIAQFRPTMIVVEGGNNTGYLMHRFRGFMKRNEPLIANEIDQIAFRLMERFSIDTLYGVDARPLVNDLYNHQDSLVLRPIIDSLFKDWDFRSEEMMSKRYNALYSYEDSLRVRQSILESFMRMNNEKRIMRGWGAYLVGDFKNGLYEGSDALAMHWYSRNLRIFRNIQNLAKNPDERIMVLFGAGHMTVLMNLFKCSPEFELIPFKSLQF